MENIDRCKKLTASDSSKKRDDVFHFKERAILQSHKKFHSENYTYYNFF